MYSDQDRLPAAEAKAEMGNIDRYNQYVGGKMRFLLICGISLLAIGVYSITVGAVHVPLVDVFNVIIMGQEGINRTVIWNIRLPRVITAIVAGAALALAGCVMQCVLRNPLASPYTLGLSQAAAFGACFAIVFFGAGSMQSGTSASITIAAPHIMTVCALGGALLGTTIIAVLAKMTRISPEAMVLAGIAIGSIFSAGITAMQFFADSVQLSSMVFWAFGDLGKSTWTNLKFIIIVAVPILAYFIYNRWNYNAIEAGEETARSLGINVDRLTLTGMVLSSILAAVVVAFMGIIGFIGLISPHMVRRFIGADYRFLIPGSALVGAITLLVADTLARTIVAPLVLPVGVLTSFLGGPLFIYLLIRGYRK